MTRGKRTQITIGAWRGEFPIVMLCGAWFTIGDWRQCDRPEVGRIILAAYAYREGEPPPSAIEILGRGAHATIGKYTNSGERRALLSGEGVEHGKR